MYKSRQTMSEALRQVAEKSLSKEDKGFSSQQIKQAYGILNDPRYKQGNYSGAYAAIEKIAKGLAKHPDVANALKRANEELEEDSNQPYVIVDIKTGKKVGSGTLNYNQAIKKQRSMNAGERKYTIRFAKEELDEALEEVNVEISDRIIDLLEQNFEPFKNDLKEFTTSQMAVLKKEYGPLKGKTLSPEQNKKLSQMLGIFDNARLKQLADTDIPMLATAAKSELVLKRGFKWSDFKQPLDMDYKPEKIDEAISPDKVKAYTRSNDHFGARIYVAQQMRDKDMESIYQGLETMHRKYGNIVGNNAVQFRDKIEKLLYGKIVGKWGTTAGDKIIKEL